MILGRELIEFLNKKHPGSARKLRTMMRHCKVPLYFAFWYILNILYNITNKWALEDVRGFVGKVSASSGNIMPGNSLGISSSLPITMGCLQFAVGSIYACTLWLLGCRRLIPHAVEIKAAVKPYIDRIKRVIGVSYDGHSYSSLASLDNNSAPVVSHPRLRDTSHIAIHHTLGQLCTVLSLSLNSIGFAHVIKAMEPFFSAIASRLFFGKRMDIRVYLALIPVVGGVIMAVAGSNEFSWLAFWFGMGSNLFFSVRAVVSKLAMDQPIHGHEDGKMIDNAAVDSKHIHTIQPTVTSPSNLFAAVTCVSFLLSIPLVIIFEGRILMGIITFLATDESNGEASHDIKRTILYTISSGLFHYLNNEVMYVVLSRVHPITLAVGNTLKRVFIIVSGVVVFSTPVTWQTAIGSAVGIGGVLFYSLMKQWYDSDHQGSKDHSDEEVNSDNNILNTELVEHNPDDSNSDQHLVMRKHIMPTT